MKRFVWMILVLLMCLCGCTQGDIPETTVATTEAETTAPEPTSLYAPEDTVEQYTQGAVNAYHLERTGARYAAMLGEKLLVFLDAGGTELMLVDPAEGTLLRSVTLNCNIQPGTQQVQIGSRGMGYFQESERMVVILDDELRETARVVLPETMLGTPAIAPALDKVYYCTENEIRVLEIHTGISRLLRQQENAWETLGEVYFDGEVLSYPEKSTGKTVYLDTATGALLDTAEGIQWMRTYGQTYVLNYLDAPVQVEELLFGDRDSGPSKLNYPGGQAFALLNAGCVVTADAQEGMLELYDLQTGTRRACVDIDGNKTVLSAAAQGESRVWLLAEDQQLQQNVLYCWDTEKSAVSDDTVYSGPWFTAEKPDSEGLAQCQLEADAIAEKYGVDIRIGEAALEAPCDYALEAEFHTQIFREKLKVVDAALAKFPEGFLKEIGKVSDSGKLHICLVRSVAENVNGLQFWHEGEAYAAVQMNGDLEYNLYLELYHILDTYIFNNTSAMDTWDTLNPKGFAYFKSYQFDEAQAQQKWLEGEKRAFVDVFGMTYPKEDRAQFFAAAMTDGHQEVFAGETMQEKLKFMGTAIRKAFDWKKDERSFPWEQYLQTPLAYQKKTK